MRIDQKHQHDVLDILLAAVSSTPLGMAQTCCKQSAVQQAS
jgi:hypothetical protein